MKIGLIDYGMGNLFSVEQALRRLNADVIVTSNRNELNTMDALILPGVGAFPDAMKKLQEANLIDFIKETKKPFLGICLGMQLMFEESEEVTQTKGLGIFEGRIERFEGVSRIPHMGWNDLTLHQKPTWLQKQAPPNDRFVYFVHSFYATNLKCEQLIASAQYETVEVPGIVVKDNFTGMQFHPEKSGELGFYLLREWANGLEATVC